MREFCADPAGFVQAAIEEMRRERDRHCEERSDERYHASASRRNGLLRFAHNDGGADRAERWPDLRGAHLPTQRRAFLLTAVAGEWRGRGVRHCKRSSKAPSQSLRSTRTATGKANHALVHRGDWTPPHCRLVCAIMAGVTEKNREDAMHHTLVPASDRVETRTSTGEDGRRSSVRSSA